MSSCLLDCGKAPQWSPRPPAFLSPPASSSVSLSWAAGWGLPAPFWLRCAQQISWTLPFYLLELLKKFVHHGRPPSLFSSLELIVLLLAWYGAYVESVFLCIIRTLRSPHWPDRRSVNVSYWDFFLWSFCRQTSTKWRAQFSSNFIFT